jgi:hypothetical protein
MKMKERKPAHESVISNDRNVSKSNGNEAKSG